MAKSFIEYSAECEFPLENIPFGVFVPPSGGNARCATAIGDQVVDLSVLADAGLLTAEGLHGGMCFKNDTLNAFMSLGKPVWKATRANLQSLLSADNATLRDNADLRSKVFVPMSQAKMVLPARVGDYTDFYASKEHATNLGMMFRNAERENALLPNWRHIPVGYHGRASSVVVDGTEVTRPKGQTKADDAEAPSFTPCRLLDFELEMGYFVGTGNKMGESIDINDAHDKIFGMVLLNDWSARDIQKWEYVPLGPFNGKNFASTISPWIVTFDALEQFMVDTPTYDKPVLPYLDQKNRKHPDIHLEVAIQAPGAEPHVITRSNLKYMYWTGEQMLTHHAVGGCEMNPGDLLGSGTISGPTEDSFGSMVELCWRGTKEIPLGNGEVRKFMKDGDVCIMRGWCQGNGFRVGFGQASGKVLPCK